MTGLVAPTFTPVGHIAETAEVVFECSDCGVLVVDLGLMQAHALTHTWPAHLQTVQVR